MRGVRAQSSLHARAEKLAAGKSVAQRGPSFSGDLGPLTGEHDDEGEIDAGLKTILDSVIGEEYLQSVTGKSDLTAVTYLQITVDLNVQSLLDISDMLPGLKSLVLDDSTMSSIRDLGIGLRCLISLSLNSCSLYDLDGIGVLTGLQDLSACDNFITDVAPLAMHDNLATLNLSGNNLSDISIADALSSCPKLSALFLGRNPIERAPNYRLVIASLIPSLERLDGSPIDAAAQRKVSHGMVLEAAFAMHQADEALDDERRIEGDLLEPNAAVRDGASQGRAEVSAGMQHQGAYRGTIPDTGSELTHGSAVVLAGNVAAAMRKRRSSVKLDDKAASSSSGSSSISSSGSSSSRSGSGRGVVGGSSTLEILDSALNGGAVGGAADGLSSPFMGEGDVTASVMGNMYPASHALNLSIALTEVAGPHPRLDPCHSPKAAGAAQARPRWRSENEASFSFDAEREYAEDVGGYLVSVNARGSRPKSAVPSSMRGSWVSAEGGGTIDEAGSDELPSHSPRQRNSSRPQSASGDGRVQPTPSAPFKVAVGASDLRHFKERIHITARQGPSDKAATVFHEGNKAKAVNKKGSRRIDELDHNDDDVASEGGLDDVAGRQSQSPRWSGSDASSATAKSPVSSRFGTKSYIHKDIMVRGPVDESDDGDGEGISTTHAARERLMSASGRRGPSTHDGPLKPSALPTPHSFSIAGSARLQPPLALPAGSRAEATEASIAGISLGFDLQGSLAAIDQWVEDMDSDDDSEELELEAPLNLLGGAGTGAGAGVMRGLGAGTGAGAAGSDRAKLLGLSVGNSDAESGRSNSSRTGSAGSNRSGRSEQRILSRDKIFSMVSTYPPAPVSPYLYNVCIYVEYLWVPCYTTLCIPPLICLLLPNSKTRPCLTCINSALVLSTTAMMRKAPRCYAPSPTCSPTRSPTRRRDTRTRAMTCLRPQQRDWRKAVRLFPTGQTGPRTRPSRGRRRRRCPKVASRRLRARRAPASSRWRWPPSRWSSATAPTRSLRLASVTMNLLQSVAPPTPSRTQTLSPCSVCRPSRCPTCAPGTAFRSTLPA